MYKFEYKQCLALRGDDRLRLSKRKGAILKQDLPDLGVAEIITARKRRISIVQKPVVLELDNRLVGSPSLYRLQKRVLPVVRAIRLGSGGDFNSVRGAGGVLEDIKVADLVQRWGLKETARAVCLHDIAVFVVDDEFLWCGGERGEVGRELSETGSDGWAGRRRNVTELGRVLKIALVLA